MTTPFELRTSNSELPPTRPLLALLIPTHHDTHWLPDFLHSFAQALAHSRFLTPAQVEIIVIDSGEEPTLETTLHTHAPNAGTPYLLVPGNVGFGAKANRGAAATSAPWLLLCNPDLTFPPTFVQNLIDPVFDPQLLPEPLWQRAAVIAPRLLNPDGTPQPSVGRFPTIPSLLADQRRPRHLRKYIHPQPDTATLVDWATGACLLLRHDAFNAVQGFDEHYFLYVEEVDLQRRLWQHNFQTWFAPEAHVTHHNPNATRPPRPQIQRYAARGLLRYFALHGTPTDLLTYRLLTLLTRRLPPKEALTPRKTLQKTPTGP